MGGKQSVEKEMNIESITKSIQKQFTENKAVSKVSGTNVQSLKLDFGILRGCGVVTNQKITSKVVSKTNNMGKVAADMSAKVANDLKQKADDQIEKSAGFLSTDFGSKQDVKTKVNTKIENITEKTMTTKNMSEAIASSVNVQGQTVNIKYAECRPGEKLEFNQDITSDLAAKAVMKTVTDAIFKDEYINKLVNETKTKATMKSDGPFESIGNMFKGIFGNMYSVIICAIVGCLILLAVAAAAVGSGMSGEGAGGGAGGYQPMPY